MKPLPRSSSGALLDSIEALEHWATRHGWVGADPYDGLNATRVPGVATRSEMGRRLVTQLVKRSPVNLRPLLGIPPGRSSAALAQAVSSYARNGFLPPNEALRKLERLIEDLMRERCAGYDEPCWGYHFDVQTRAFFYPEGSPNTIATAFAGNALLDAYEVTGDARLLEWAVGTGNFFLRWIPQTVAPPGEFFGYLVGDRTPIHNANLLVCGLLARLSSVTGLPDFRAAAHIGAEYTIARQRPDGSWPYGESSHLDWVDGFHTGYVLECLSVCASAGIHPGAEDALASGLEFYRRALFLDDGTPRYYTSSTYPIDIQCAAQGIQTFVSGSRVDPALIDWAWKVFGYAYARLRRRDGAFVFQRRRFWTNSTPHLRWAQAPMLRAMTHLLASQGGSP
jgi:hypothetical protein